MTVTEDKQLDILEAIRRSVHKGGKREDLDHVTGEEIIAIAKANGWEDFETKRMEYMICGKPCYTVTGYKVAPDGWDYIFCVQYIGRDNLY